jgi:trimethylamine:corrinoid methyltransferase-like protein
MRDEKIMQNFRPEIQPHLSEAELDQLHTATLQILKDVGVTIHDSEAVALFKHHGVKVVDNTVFLDEKTISDALGNAPSTFSLQARNADGDVRIGDGSFVLAPGYGAPFVISRQGERRRGTIADYRDFCKLVHTSSTIDVNGFMMVDPADLPPGTSHLDMMLANITLCDKSFVGSGISREAAREALEMARMVWGRTDKPVMLANVNSLAPLQIAGDMAGALMVFAKHGQPVIVMGGGAMGSTAPIQVAGFLAVQNAAVLTGITLAQLVNPGTPVLYGVGGGLADMRTGAYYLGGPECFQCFTLGAQLARFYGLPTRGGGGLNDTHIPDIQTGMESTLALSASARAGIDFILHACGILGTYMAMSFEKFIVDEDLCAVLRALRKPVLVSEETIALQTIKDVGTGGEYLTHPKTFELCRTALFRSSLRQPADYEDWSAEGRQGMGEKAASMVQERLEEYRRPDIGSGLEKDLLKYVEVRKKAV